MSEETRMAKLAVGGASVVPLARPKVEEAAPLLPEEQLVYARWLDGGMKAGLLLLTVTFVLYVAGALSPHVPVADLPRYWSLPVKDYLAATGIHAGWGWLVMLGKGDFLNFVGIAFLSAVTIACYAAVTPIFFRKRDRVYGWLAVLEVLVLAFAASGILGSGGH